jgi:arylsulfatase A-like enzyme
MMSRYFILLIFTALPALAAPNIIYIMADDMGYADAGCYGGKYVKTPTLDRMAAEGMRFTDAYSGAPVCAPARSVLMTGKHTGHTTVRGNFGKHGGVKGLGGGKGRVPLLAEDVTVAEVLKAAGYHTGMTGKWGLGEPNTTGEPNSQGFDEWFGYLNQRRAHTYYPDFIWKNREKFPLPGNTGGKKTQYTHDLCADFALDFITRNHAKPFFLYIPYCIPHSKLEIPDLGPYADDTKFGKAERTYSAMITRMDTDIGKMMALLEELKIDDNTIVFFCSDNGAASRYDGKLNSSGPLRGRKRDMYEGGLRVPMIVRWPGKIKAGAVSSAPWTFADVLPTCAELGGGTAPEGIDGVSVAPTLLGKQQELAERRLYWEFYEGGFKQAARFGKWKAVRTWKKPTEIYDLTQDLGEKNNLAKSKPELVKEFETYFKSERTPSKGWPSPLD